MHRILRAVLRLGLGLCAAACLGLAAPVHAASVVVVTSEANTGVVDTANAAIAELQRLGISVDDIVRERASNFSRTASGRSDVRLYLTLGVEALREVLKANVREPVVAALIPKAALDAALSENGRRSGSLSALYLDQPLNRQLSLVRLALPDAKRIGLVLGPESLSQQAAAVAAIKAHGMETAVGQVAHASSLFAGLKPALEESDVLLALPDALVFNNATVPSILMATYRARIPLVAFSPAYVKAGALLCVFSTPQQMGVQAASMVQGVLRGAQVPAQYPQEFSVRVNDSVARSLGLVLREEQLNEQLRRQERRP